VRENSDDKSHYGYANMHHQQKQQRSPQHPYAMDNHAFHHDDDSGVSDAMRKHKELVAKMMGGGQDDIDDGYVPQNGNGYYENTRHSSQTSDYRHPSQSSEYGGAPYGKSVAPKSPYSRSPGVPSPYGQGDVRSPSGYSQNGGRSPHTPGASQQFDYAPRQDPYRPVSGYGSRHPSASQQQVEESFI
jgi:hypothetical protein